MGNRKFLLLLFLSTDRKMGRMQCMLDTNSYVISVVVIYSSSNVSPQQVFQTLHISDPPKFTADDRRSGNRTQFNVIFVF
jgi:hypothetical protein